MRLRPMGGGASGMVMIKDYIFIMRLDLPSEFMMLALYFSKIFYF